MHRTLYFSSVWVGLAGLSGVLYPAFSVAAPPTSQQSSAPVAALIEHTTKEVTASGVYKTLRFQEKLYRSNNDVWIERVIPAVFDDDHGTEKGGAGHKHLNKDRCARWISRLPDGSVRFRLVDSEHKTVVDVLPAEYSSVGFNGRWDMAYHLLAPTYLSTLKAEGSKVGGVQRYVRKDASQKVLVVWDSGKALPNQMQFEDAKGMKEQSAKVSWISVPAQMPWTRLSGFKQMELSDFMD